MLCSDDVGVVLGRVPASCPSPFAEREVNLLCGATIGTPDSWRERAATVRSAGTDAVMAGAAQRWFSEGFPERQPRVSAALLRALRDTDPTSYAQICGALAGFDISDRLRA
jgi:3-oxoadipate enol-lactonase/4-carboxymuconolactone decarboxylase